jgi:hypothetical protein
MVELIRLKKRGGYKMDLIQYHWFQDTPVTGVLTESQIERNRILKTCNKLFTEMRRKEGTYYGTVKFWYIGLDGKQNIILQTGDYCVGSMIRSEMKYHYMDKCYYIYVTYYSYGYGINTTTVYDTKGNEVYR